MADTRYLQKRGNCWYVRVPSPPPLWGVSGEFVASLHTPDLKPAQRLRDKYLMPLLAETAAGNMVNSIARLASAADEAVKQQLAQLRGGLSGIEAELTLRQAGDSFLAYLKSSGSYAPASLRKYSASLDALCRLLGADANPETVKKSDVAQFRDSLLTLPINWQRSDRPIAPAGTGARRISPKTVSKYLMDSRRMFRWLISEGRLFRRDNPFDGVTVARITENHKRPPNPEEAEPLMSLPRPHCIDADTWRMMPLLARYTGCRAGELAQLRAEDVEVKQGVRCLRVTAHGEGKQLKTASSERLVPVSDKLAPHLDALLAKRPSGRLIEAGDWKGSDGMVKYAHTFLKHYNRRAKKVADDLSFHAWRTYFNDALATASVDILDRERLLGHKSERTQASYTPENLRRLKQAVDTVA